MTSATTRVQRPGALWAAPALIFFGIFGLAPIAIVAGLSFTTWDGLGNPEWAGLHNWRTLPSDKLVGSGLMITLTLTVLTWATQTPLALAFGAWAAGPQRIRAVVSTIFFLPLLLSTAAIALIWQALLDPTFGLPAQWSELTGLSANVLGDPDLALWAIVFVLLWQFLPFHMLLYQAAAKQIPASLYEAAEIDGASPLQRFWRITVPQLRHTIIASSVLMIVGSMTYFETVLLLTGGGPGTATRILPLHMYLKGFSAFEMGYASAIAVLLVAVGTGLSLLVVRVSGYSQMTSEREGV
ncbi:possible binding-protein-dependent transport protein [Thermobifida fusca YX]|uniref:Possible binding-protein-dependent transport protein n=1 Tax=Thermobifida fusca (strain YX) TaxID=269800 RepID=Q47PG6_THEFY|nr:possible binding-protein-dependent transport protein [Thermobifida fusca YX]